MNLNFTPKQFWILLLLSLGFLPFSCNKDEQTTLTLTTLQTEKYTAEVAVEWFSLATELVKTTSGFTPPVMARAMGYMGVTLYEAVVPGMPEYQSLAGQISDLKPQDLPLALKDKTYFWPLVANSALGAVTEYLFSNASAGDKIRIAALRDQFESYYRGQTDFETRDRSITFGKVLGDAIVAWAAKDKIGDNAQLRNFPADYVLPTGPEKWVPTSAQLIPLQPYWGKARTFIPNCVKETEPAPPFTFSTATNSRFYGQALEVYTVSKEIQAQEKVIAEYWADGGGTVTPPGHSISIATQLIKEEKQNLAKAALLYARLGMAVNDAFVSCWSCKYAYNLLRPVTYIQKYIDPAWKPLIGTPPFPEYTSGHSTQSGAAAIILSETFGYNYAFVDITHRSRTDINGSPRRFTSFTEAANEAMNSRLFGGIHYRMGNERGLSQGMEVGKKIMNLRFER